MWWRKAFHIYEFILKIYYNAETMRKENLVNLLISFFQKKKKRKEKSYVRKYPKEKS